MSRLMNQDVPWESHTLPSSSSSSSSTSSICKPWNLPDIHPIFNSGRSFGEDKYALKSDIPTRHIVIYSSSTFFIGGSLFQELAKNGEIRAVYPYLSTGITIISYFKLSDAQLGLQMILSHAASSSSADNYQFCFAKPQGINKNMNEKIFVTINGSLDNYMDHLLKIGSISSFSEANIATHFKVINLEYDDERAREKVVQKLNNVYIDDAKINVFKAESNTQSLMMTTTTAFPPLPPLLTKKQKGYQYFAHLISQGLLSSVAADTTISTTSDHLWEKEQQQEEEGKHHFQYYSHDTNNYSFFSMGPFSSTSCFQKQQQEKLALLSAQEEEEEDSYSSENSSSSSTTTTFLSTNDDWMNNRRKKRESIDSFVSSSSSSIGSNSTSFSSSVFMMDAIVASLNIGHEQKEEEDPTTTIASDNTNDKDDYASSAADTTTTTTTTSTTTTATTTTTTNGRCDSLPLSSSFTTNTNSPVTVSNASKQDTSSNQTSSSQQQNNHKTSISKKNPRNNDVIIEKVKKGQDKRSSIMIRNIPNKYTLEKFMDWINETHTNTYDFLYLPIDFNNKCNVGFAFINFIDYRFVVSFAEARIGQGWTLFKSEKLVELAYADTQGRQALINKFRNSPVMKKEEISWRPKIFFSSGPNTGQEEPFPPPTVLMVDNAAASTGGDNGGRTSTTTATEEGSHGNNRNKRNHRSSFKGGPHDGKNTSNTGAKRA